MEQNEQFLETKYKAFQKHQHIAVSSSGRWIVGVHLTHKQQTSFHLILLKSQSLNIPIVNMPRQTDPSNSIASNHENAKITIMSLNGL